MPSSRRAGGAVERLQVADRLEAVGEEEHGRRLLLAVLGELRRRRAEGREPPLGLRADRLAGELRRPRDRVADRRAALRGQVRERLPDELAVARHRRDDLGVAGERDHADAELGRQAVEELPDRLLRRLEARRLDVVGEHRARGVDGEHDRRLLAVDHHVGLRPGERERERCQREQEERGR